MDKIKAQVRFCHDMEDGWYRIDYNEVMLELNHWKDMKEYIKEHDLDAAWVGDTYYKPDGIEVAV